MKRDAVLSKGGKYRYTLTRDWSDLNVGSYHSGLILWVMLNPSTADAEQDDATIRRVISFSQLWGFEAAAVVNLYAYRATQPDDLWKAAREGTDIIGPKNDKWIAKEVYHAQRVICAWGGNADFHRPKQVLQLLGASKKRLWVLGTTRSGHPLHPLRLAAHTEPIKWKHPYGEGEKERDGGERERAHGRLRPLVRAGESRDRQGAG